MQFIYWVLLKIFSRGGGRAKPLLALSSLLCCLEKKLLFECILTNTGWQLPFFQALPVVYVKTDSCQSFQPLNTHPRNLPSKLHLPMILHPDQFFQIRPVLHNDQFPSLSLLKGRHFVDLCHSVNFMQNTESISSLIKWIEYRNTKIVSVWC